MGSGGWGPCRVAPGRTGGVAVAAVDVVVAAVAVVAVGDAVVVAVGRAAFGSGTQTR